MFELNRIHQGDAFNLTEQLDNESIDLTFTSPPYADMKVYENNCGINPNEYVDWFLPLVVSLSRKTKLTGSFILNINDKVVNKFRHPYVFDLISRICKETDFKLVERLFWDKGKYLPHPKRFGDRVEYIFWFAKSTDFYIDIDAFRRPYNKISLKRMQNPIKKRFNRNILNNNTTEYKDWKPNAKGALPSTLVQIGSESKRISNKHFAVFPIKFANYFIKGACPEGGIVLDPFMGSGTTAIAALGLNRQWIGFENGEQTVIDANHRILSHFSN